MKRRDINAIDAPQPVGGYSQAVELTGATTDRVGERADSVTADGKVPETSRRRRGRLGQISSRSFMPPT